MQENGQRRNSKFACFDLDFKKKFKLFFIFTCNAIWILRISSLHFQIKVTIIFLMRKVLSYYIHYCSCPYDMGETYIIDFCYFLAIDCYALFGTFTVGMFQYCCQTLRKAYSYMSLYFYLVYI